ncbi:MAG: major facilitator family transporter [Sphingomonas bacterium]|uniref:sugar porter family MFS transporter n=1 Tax=Sphingomonas bacterium TaxID=1895847 RepID=UPI00261A8F65|nr:sugar porter family MFS transporter [Sphingomonas bacterium]MDB5703316.1 major facilitator family transporter [Sphingomonas bacterium]
MASAGAERANMSFIALIVAVATIGGFMFGYDSGVINGTQDGLRAAFNLDDAGLGVAVAALLPGCAFGAFLAGRLADLFGRRAVMMSAALIFIASALLAGAAGSAVLFIAARFVAGLAVGAASVISPVYISEVTPASIRGRLSSVQQIMIIAGLTGAFLANYWLAHTAGESTASFWLGYPAWRWMFWMQVIPAGIYFLALLLIPESPRYLMLKDRDAEAGTVLTKLFGATYANDKVREIRDSLAADHHRPRFSDLIDKSTGKIRKIVWAGIGLAVFQQLVGINIVFYYGAVLWQSVGFSENDALLINIGSGLLSIAACLFTIFTIDKIGRKPLLLVGSAGMAVTLAVMAWCFSTATFIDGGMHLSDETGKVALVAANLYVIFFNLSWGPVMWVMLGEMFPNQIRGSGLAVSGFAQWGANFAISVSFPWLASNIGLPITYGFYAASALISFFFVKAMINETRGRELEDMVG